MMYYPRATELAWAAGFFDGEGTTCTTSKVNGNSRAISLSVAQATPDLLFRFMFAVGIGGIGTSTNGMFAFHISGLSNTQYALGLLWPYLGETKKQQARSAVKRFVIDHPPIFRCHGIG